jgi:hypothetical protein
MLLAPHGKTLEENFMWQASRGLFIRRVVPPTTDLNLRIANVRPDNLFFNNHRFGAAIRRTRSTRLVLSRRSLYRAFNFRGLIVLANSPAAARALNRAISGREMYCLP